MKYALLIYGSETERTTWSQEQIQAEMNAYWGFETELQGHPGMKHGGEALHPTHEAKCVRIRDGKMLTTDGPFAETKEQLGGFYLLDCKDMDEALAWAAKIPGARDGIIEVRPVVVFG